ncbi:MAG: DNA translocase FtsK [Candidatus Limimorpha sp.]
MTENKNRLRVFPAPVEESKKEAPPKKKKKTKPKQSKVGKRQKETDGRFRICIGLFFVLISIFLLIAFASPYFGFAPRGIWLYNIGRFMSEKMFGIGTLYIIFLITLLGLNLVDKRIYIKPWTLWKYLIMSLLWVPIFIAMIFSAIPINISIPFQLYYGLIGQFCYAFLFKYIGLPGVILLLFFALVTYIIFTFNIKFSFLKKTSPTDEAEIDSDGKDDDSDDPINDSEEEKILPSPKPANFKRSPSDEKATEIDLTDGFELKGEEEETTQPKDEEDYPEIELEDEEIEGQPITVKRINIHEEEPVEIESEKEYKIETINEGKTEHTDNEPVDEGIEIEIEEQKKEKQVHTNGEHFGLDTLYDPKFELSSFKLPPLSLLKDYGDGTAVVDRNELEANKKRIVDTLKNYSIEVDKIKATIGPTVTLYEIVPAAGVRISKIKGLQDDIALCLSALGIRIIAPIPGKGTIGIEVPNQKPQIVSMRSIIGSEKFQRCGYELPFGIGKTISNESYVADLAKMPHILMAGATGQGKSVGLNAIIASLLYCKHPSELKFVLVDPKKVELSLFRKIERHYLAKLPDAEDAIITDVRKVVRTLNSLCIEMDNRYELLKDAGVRNIKEYNAKFISRRLSPYDGHRFLPYIVLVVDEFADLIMTAGREVEGPIARLAQLARAIGIHLIIATQRPSVKIITGNIKANFTARIAFRVISRVDSATILDNNGAEQLVGRGDMLMSTGGDLVRLQCPFIDTPEVEAICDFIGSQRGYPEAYLLPECPDEQDDGSQKESYDSNERDPLFEDAARIVVQTQQGSTSMLQRKLKLGYNRAGRIIDQLEKAGIVGPFAGSKQREVKVATEFALEQFLKDLDLEENIKNNELI